MLLTLSIRDFVIVDQLELHFDAGFTVLTGETGAGKSILIDALALVLGERADAGVVKQGAARADISAEFEVEAQSRLASWLLERDLAGDGTCLLRRTIESGGRARAFVNGTPVTVAQLREAGEYLVDIHGQHEHQSLLRPAVQRELLDAYGGTAAAAAQTAQAHRAWRQRVDQRLAYETHAAALAAELEQLQWQAAELEALELTAEGWQDLQAEHGRLANAASLIDGAQFGLESLAESDMAVLTQLNAVVARLETLLEYDSQLRDVVEVLRSAAIQIQDGAYGLRHYHQKLDMDPHRLREADRRLEEIHSAARKYRITPEDIPAVVERTRRRVAELDATGDPEALKKLEHEALEAYMKVARALSASRRVAAVKLAREVTTAMQTLAMPGGAFAVEFIGLDAPALHGLETIEFRVTAHESMSLQPLARVASGGELSRLSLAIQTVASQITQVPTLVFDEVDTGIGGRVADIVGTLLSQLGRKRQVMCITHLPQVAAAADHQWQVSKTVSKTRVSSRVTPLDNRQRIEEVARMLGGVKITETTRRHAAEMLSSRKP